MYIQLTSSKTTKMMSKRDKSESCMPILSIGVLYSSYWTGEGKREGEREGGERGGEEGQKREGRRGGKERLIQINVSCIQMISHDVY